MPKLKLKKIFPAFLLALVIFGGVVGVFSKTPIAEARTNQEIEQEISILESEITSLNRTLNNAPMGEAAVGISNKLKDLHVRELVLLKELEVNNPNDLSIKNRIKNTEIRIEYYGKTSEEIAKENKVRHPTAPGECSVGVTGITWGNCLRVLVSWILGFVLWLFTLILWFANEMFNQAINISVRTFGSYANMPAVKVAWGVIRDLVNMGFIFVLLYIAISTILGVGANDWKKLVPKLIIVALLVNFSMFFTRVVIDISNVTANQFYTASAQGETSGRKDANGKVTWAGAPDVTTALMKSVKIFSLPGIAPASDAAADAVTTETKRGALDWYQIIIGFLGGIAMALVASFVFFTGAVLFIIRTIRLLFLIILSPFAFFFLILPKTAGYAGKWFKTLMDDATFAPAFLIMIYIVTKISVEISALPGRSDGSPIFFILIMGLLLGAIIVAKALGAAGASGAMKFASRANAFAVGTGMGVARLAGRGISAADRATGGRLYGKPGWLGKGVSKVGSGISSTLKQVDKISPSVALARRNITEGIASPLKTGGDLLSRVTKEHGISSSILGSTKDEDRELRKREKEDKEAMDKNKLDQEKRDIENLKIGNTPEEKQKAQEKVQNIGGKTIVKIDVDSLIRLATLLTDQQMTSLEKELDSDKFAKIKTAREKPLGDALGYNDKGERTTPIDETKIKAELDKMSHQTVAKLKEGWLERQEIINNLVEEDIKEMRKNGVSTGTIDKVTGSIKAIGPSHPAHDYVTKSPARGIPTRRPQVSAIVGPAPTTTPPPTAP